MAISPGTTNYFIPPDPDSFQPGSSHRSQPAQGAPQSLSELAFAMEFDEPGVGVAQLPASDGSSHGSQPAHGSPGLSLAQLAFTMEVDGS